MAIDLSTASAQDILEGTGLSIGDIDVVIGGPPCQGFSVIGSRRMGDPRNQLVFDFLRLASELEARYFVMENVPGFMQGKMATVFTEWMTEAQRLGYSVVEPVWQLNAADFGVPQNRIRCFAVGYRDGLPAPEPPQPGSGCSCGCQLQLRPTVGDAISDLPEPTRFIRLLKSDRIPARYGHSSMYAEYMKGHWTDPCDLSIARELDNDTLTGCKRTVHTERSKRRFRKTAPGATEAVSRFQRLDPQGTAPTLRAGTRFGTSGYTAARPIHQTQPRCITVREAARLQSFPDWFEFHPTIWHGFRQVGNSVPPLLARAVGSKIAQLFETEQQLEGSLYYPVF